MTFPTLIEGSRWRASWHNTFVKAFFEMNPPHILTAKGDIPVANNVGLLTRLGIGTSGQMLESQPSMIGGRRYVNSGLVPVGGIVIWSGSIASIPSGWQLCDGTNSTPDLRDRFVVGSGSAYTTGNTGGATTADLSHTHTGSSTSASGGSHTHTQASTSSSGDHYHDLLSTTNNDNSVVGQIYEDPNPTRFISPTPHTHPLSGRAPSSGTSGAHSHTNPDFDVNSTGSHTHTATITTDSVGPTSQNVMPPYYALAYIMRMT